MIELTEENYCDQKPVTMQFSFEEHDFYNEILTHAISSYDFMGFYEIDTLPGDSEIKRKYNMLMEMRERSHKLWVDRFGNPPYNNN